MSFKNRLSGRIGKLLPVAVLAVAAASMQNQAIAQQDTEYLLSDLGIAQVVDDLAQQLNTTCPTCNLPKVGTTDIVGATVAIAIGNIKPQAGVALGNIGPLAALAGYCQPYLNQFLANTEYLGPLLDYGLCIETNSVPAIMAALPKPTANVQFLAGACTILLKAGYRTTTFKTEFSGTTDCTTGASSSGTGIFGAALGGQALMGDYLYDTTFASTNTTASGPGWFRSSGLKTGSITSTAKVKYSTMINPNPPAYYCPSSEATCGYKWVVLPNKNVDTGSKTQCNQNVNSLQCQANSIPLTSTTIHKY